MEDEQKTCSVFIGKIILDSQDEQLIWVPLLFPALGNGNNSLNSLSGSGQEEKLKPGSICGQFSNLKYRARRQLDRGDNRCTTSTSNLMCTVSAYIAPQDSFSHKHL